MLCSVFSSMNLHPTHLASQQHNSNNGVDNIVNNLVLFSFAVSASFMCIGIYAHCIHRENFTEKADIYSCILICNILY